MRGQVGGGQRRIVALFLDVEIVAVIHLENALAGLAGDGNYVIQQLAAISHVQFLDGVYLFSSQAGRAPCTRQQLHAPRSCPRAPPSHPLRSVSWSPLLVALAHRSQPGPYTVPLP